MKIAYQLLICSVILLLAIPAQAKRVCRLSNYGYAMAIQMDGSLHKYFSSIAALVQELNRLRESGDCTIEAIPCWLAAHGWYPAIGVHGASIFLSNPGSLQATANDITTLVSAGACQVRARPCSVSTYGASTPSLFSERHGGHLFLMRTHDEVRENIAMLRERGLCAAN